MKRRRKSIVETGATLPLSEIIAAIGIQLMVWAETLEYGAISSDDEVLGKIAHEMLTHSEVLSEIEKQYPKLSASIRVRLPDDIGVMRVPNPLRQSKVSEADAEAPANDDDSVGEPPF